MNEPGNKPKNPLHKVVFDINEYFGKATIEKAADLFEKIEIPLIKANQTGIVQRNLSHWVKVLEENTTGNKQKKYTFVEFFWLKIVEQLRTLNIGLDIIKEFKKQLLQPIIIEGLFANREHTIKYIKGLKLSKDKEEELLKLLTVKEEIEKGSYFTMLHMIIIDSIINKLPLRVAVFNDGTYLILDKSKEHLYTENENNRLLYECHVVISIAQIMKDFLNSNLSGFVVPAISLLSYPENKLFESIHNNNYDKIIINFQDKSVNSLELNKNENIKEQLLDIMKKEDFEEIIVKKNKGIIAKIENKIKIKL